MTFSSKILAMGVGVCFAAGALVGTAGYASSTPDINISKAEMRADVEYYASEFPKRHINAFHTLSKAEFDKEIEGLLSKLDTLSNLQATAELMRITNRIGDGHTSVSWYNFSEMYPFEITIYGDRFIITGTNKDNAAYLGHVITHIDGKPIQEIADAIAPYTSGIENEWSWKNRVALFVTLSDLLHGLNLTESNDTADFTLMSDMGESKIVSIGAINDDDYFNTLTEKANIATAEYLQKPETAWMDNLWYRALPDNKSVYVRFDSYPDMETMRGFSYVLANYIAENQLSRIVIDLRYNGGGDYFVGLMLARPLVTLDSIDWLDGIFVLTGRKTFSAAMSNAAQYKQMLNAKLVGEPTGADPVGFQELGTFELPNSKRNIYHSKRVFRFQDVNSEGIQPDIFIPRNWDLEKQGRDPVIEWILNH